MGVTGLPALLKEGCSIGVNLDDGRGGAVLCDGHWMAHRALAKAGVALTVMNGCVRKLASAVITEVRRFQKRGWFVVLVVDGKVPPAKRDTSAARAARRERALNEMGQPGLSRFMLADLARTAARLTPEIIARMLILVRSATNCECVVSPYEADGELVLLEELFLKKHKRVFVYCADHDLMVIGVQSLLWEVREPDGKDGSLTGTCTLRCMMLRPHHLFFFHEFKGVFLRRLHGWTIDTGVADYMLSEAAISRRLLSFALLAGNDYCSLRGIGPVRAQCIALPSLTPDSRRLEMANTRAYLSSDALQQLVTNANNGADSGEAAAGLRVAHTMFRNQVVWRPGSGQVHLSGEATQTSLTSSTGPIIEDVTVAERVARGDFSPLTGREWEPALKQDSLIGFQLPRSSGGTGLGQGFGPDRGTPNPYTYHQVAAARLPTSSDNCDGWTVNNLTDLLTELRLTERSGCLSLPREKMVRVTQLCAKVVEESGLAGNRLLFRAPAVSTTPEDTLREVMPDLPPPGAHWSQNYATLRPYLPEMQEAVILAWLSLDQSRKNWEHPPAQGGSEQPPKWEPPARVLARGMERVMDLGALKGLMGTFVGNVLFVRHRVHASMHDKWYNVYVKIEIQHADLEPASSSDQEQPDVQPIRWLATAVLRALCECRAGRAGKCHHVAMVLQLLRLLGMPGRELESWDPTSVTGRTCQWLLNHQAGGRDSNDNVFWGMTLPQMAQECRKVRDPKGSPMLSEAVGKSRGVVSVNRESDFNEYPQGGAWAGKAEHHLAGESISVAQESNFKAFSALVKKAGYREEENRRGVGYATPLEERRVASDVLPPLVRHDPF